MEGLKISEAQLYEELKSINRLGDFLAWEYSCDLVIDKMRELINDKSLHASTRKSLIFRRTRLENHLEILRRQYIHSGGGIKRKTNGKAYEFYWQEIETAFSGRLATGAVMNVNYIDPQQFLTEAEETVIQHIKEYLTKFNNIKVNTILNGEFIIKEKIAAMGFNTRNNVLYITSDLHQWYVEHVVKPIIVELEEFQERDSGWALYRIINLMVNINKYNPFHAGCYEDLPIDITKKHAIINIKSHDNACFAHAVVAALFPVQTHVSRVSSYPDPETVLDLSDIVHPMTLGQIANFEKLNNVSVNVYTDERYTDEKCKHMLIVPLHCTKQYQGEKRHVDLFYIPKSNGTNGGHFALIKNLSRLVGTSLSLHQHKKYICRR